MFFFTTVISSYEKKQVTLGTSFLLVYQVFGCVSIVSNMNCTDCYPRQFLTPTKKKTHCVEELESQLIDSWKTKLGDPEQHLECKNTIISIFGLNNILQKMGKPKISNFLKTCKTTSFPYGILSFGLSLFLSGFEGQLDSDHPQPPKDPKWTPSYINRLMGSL